MSILSARNLSQSFGAVDLFAGVHVDVSEGDRIGLVGPNGVGKTTLLLALVGQSRPATGQVHRASSARIGHLPQEAVRAFEDEGRSVRGELRTAFDDLRATESRLAEMEQRMAAGHGDEALVERYGKLQERFELAGGYDYETRIDQVLQGLHLHGEVARRPLSELSGGQKTRVLLGRLLLERPDLLVLDEPTNHLDVDAVEWLEAMLARWEGAVLAVSHDRYFLDRMATKIWELSAHGVEEYRGNYSAYVAQREERWDRRVKEFHAVRERLERELDYVRRNIAGQRTNQAKGKLSRLSREVEAIHAGGLQIVDKIRGAGWLQATADLDMERPSDKFNEVGKRIDELREPDGAPERIHIELAPADRSGEIILRTHDLEVGYPGTPLFVADDIELRRGHVAALIGPNGVGKTTFLRTILERHPPLAGSVEHGASLDIGYFAQAHEDLDPSRTVIEELTHHHSIPSEDARGYLAQFLFRGDDVFKPVSALSGGERGRLAIAILARRGANFLVLDEPTNHLDLQAQEVLEAVLQAFDGTVLMVTHDRYLVDRLATQIWSLRDGRLDVFVGGYGRWLEERERRRVDGGSGSVTSDGRSVVAGASDGSRAATVAHASSADGRAGSDVRVALSKNERRRIEDEVGRLEERIGELEASLEELATDMQQASEEGDYEEIQRIGAAHDQTEDALRRLYREWEEKAAVLG